MFFRRDERFPNALQAISKGPQLTCALAVDAEEDFDWNTPLLGADHSTHCMRNIRDLQEVVGAYGIVPTYLLTYPVLEDDEVVQILRHQMSRRQCDVGVQLHPWVNPPFDEGHFAESAINTSFSGNLPAGLEERKLIELKRRFSECFGIDPKIYRAGRYGIGPDTAAMLERHGFTIDISLAPHTNSNDEGGPDNTLYDYQVFWFGEQRRLLELPLCRSIVGWGGELGTMAYRSLMNSALNQYRVSSVLSRLRFAERITLSPEGNDAAAMLRLVRHLRARGQNIFVLSFHSSSLAVGRNPYVRTKADLHGFYDRLSATLDALASGMQCQFARLADLPGYLEEPPP